MDQATTSSAASSPSVGEAGARPEVETGSVSADASSLAPEAAAKLLTITEGAADFAREKLAKRGTPDAAIRLGIKGGGCSGFGYVIEFSDDEPRSRDRVFEVKGVRFYVDKKSMIYLAGSMLDYERKLMFQGFKFRNPNEASSCGCGHSFTVK